MKVALAQLNPTVGDFEGNLARIAAAHERAAAAGAGLVLYPEMAVCGYPPRDLLLRPGFVEASLAALERLAARLRGPAAVVGAIDRNPTGVGRPLRNLAAVIEGGRVVARTAKTLLPTYDVFDEDRYFEPAPSVAPILLGETKAGVTICEDVWNDEDFWQTRLYRRDPVKELKAQGIGMLVNISASPWNLGKDATRFRMLGTLARSERIPVFYCNAIGGNDELIFDGNSLAFDATGRLLAAGKAFEEDLVLADTAAPTPAARAEPGEEEALFRALTLGLRDYVRKCGFRAVVLGLSGGIDSALTACLAAAALGRENVTGVAMPSRFSSEGSVRDARLIAERLGIRLETIAIQPIVDAYRAALAPVFAGRPEDTTEENLQSRARGALLMGISNKFGSLLVTTGNKSELATGYCTLYGDMCGGLAVISDLSKMQVYALSRWINAHPAETGLARDAIPSDSITKPPSAELRPNQTDQDSLPPYDLLDRVLEAWVERHESAAEIARGVDAALVRDLTRKMDLNEYKRRQAAPGLKVTSKAFGIGRRIPIAQKCQGI